MSAVTSTSSENYYVKSTTESAAAKEAEESGRVTHDDFMTLLMAQLQNQDPLSPVNDSEFVGQMAQLQALDEQVRVGDQMEAMRSDGQLQSANGMIGKSITGTGTTGADAAGIVKSVVQEDGVSYLVLDNFQRVTLDNVKTVSSVAVAEKPTTVQEAASLIGSYVYGKDANGQSMEGIVIGARQVSNGGVMLILPDNKQMPYDNVATVTVAVSSDPDQTDGEAEDTSSTDETADAGDSSSDAA